MALLGVLLGITMCALAGAIAYGWQRVCDFEDIEAALNESMLLLNDRIVALEKKPIPLDPKPTAEKAKPVKVARWNEDVEAKEA